MVNKMIQKTIIYFLIIAFSFAILTSETVFAQGNLAVSAGKNFGDGVNTVEDAVDASSAYEERGYTVVTLTNPSTSSFTSSTNSTQRIKADILFLSGHGNEDVLSLGDNCKIACDTSSTASKYVNIWDTAVYQYIITFAGCNTAGGSKSGNSVASSDNITSRAVDRGASVAVGWTTTVSAGSHTNWLKRYNDALADGKSVSAAIDKANSYIYLPGSGVKNVVYYGNGNTKLKTISASQISKETYLHDIKLMSKKDLISIEKILRNIDFNINNTYENDDIIVYRYKKDKGYLIDIYYKADGTITNAAITLEINSSGIITGFKMYNVISNKLEGIKKQLEKIKTHKASDNQKTAAKNLYINNIDNGDIVTGQNQFQYYDFETNKTYLVTYTQVEDSDGAVAVLENMVEIK